ncbi:MAG: nitrophenyl compound nitroreductase subunit ArsF family protein [Thermoguttaceae bacterium]
MKENARRIITAILLLFAGVTLAVQVGKEFREVTPIQFPDGLNVVCTHATTRCPTCLTMKRLTNELLQEEFAEALNSRQISFQEVNYEQPEAADFACRFKVATASVVLFEVKDGQIVSGKNLADAAWNLYTDDAAFKTMLKEQIDAMLEWKTLDVETGSEEIIFGDDEEILF